MKRTARRFVVKDKLYGVIVEFYVNTPQKTALRRCAAVMEMSADDPENQPDEDAAAWTFSDKNWHCVWIGNYPEDRSSLGHEVCHVVCSALRHIESNDEETRAYLTGHIEEEFYKRMDRK
jgi:hypothetical protein